MEDWFKIKKYPHIGRPIRNKDYNRVKAYVDNSDKISKHSFLPFIHKVLLKRKFRACKDNSLLNPSHKRCRIKEDPKVRHIYFASHLDSMIFSKYNNILIDAYEKLIQTESFNNSVVAYRKIPVEIGAKGNKCNIDFTKTVFEYIKNNQNNNLTVIVADITSFFDNLDHKVLKRKWTEVLGKKNLPPDHYNVFKALTRVKYVESKELFNAYNKEVYVERGVSNCDKKKEFVRKKVNDIKYFKEKNVVYYCETKDFIENNLNLIRYKNSNVGIPQGSPVSATLANIYMLDFDRLVYNKIELINGFYQRYSDDLIVVCKREYEDEIIKLIRDSIECDSVKLRIENKKTKIYHFGINNGLFTGYQIDEVTKIPYKNRVLEYLGFSYDGQRVLIKTAGFSKFYRSMKGAFNRASYYAIHNKNTDYTLFKSRLYKRFTYKGSKPKLIYSPLKNNPQIYVPTDKYFWGNYLSYINKSNKVMKAINDDDLIKKQSRKIWNKFHVLLKIHSKKISDYKMLNGILE